MDDLRRMVIFFHVVEAQSFSGAARQLGIARSAISRHITLLEKNIGVRLLNRTTRRLSLTEAETATQSISQLQEEPCGTLKIAAPISLGNQFITPLVRAFMQRYTALNVELLLDDEMVDMVGESIDVSIRVGWLPRTVNEGKTSLKSSRSADARQSLTLADIKICDLDAAGPSARDNVFKASRKYEDFDSRASSTESRKNHAGSAHSSQRRNSSELPAEFVRPKAIHGSQYIRGTFLGIL